MFKTRANFFNFFGGDFCGEKILSAGFSAAMAEIAGPKSRVAGMACGSAVVRASEGSGTAGTGTPASATAVSRGHRDSGASPRDRRGVGGCPAGDVRIDARGDVRGS